MPECYANIAKIYSFSKLPREDIRSKVEELLDKDRFICRRSTRNVSIRMPKTPYRWLKRLVRDCHPTLTVFTKVVRGRFRAVEIVNIIYHNYFEGPWMRGRRDPDFLQKINGNFVCLVATVIRHCLKAWREGECENQAVEFKYETAWCKLIQDPLCQMKTDGN